MAAKIKLIGLLTALCFAAPFAAPTITGTNGILSNGSTVTISGKGFGTKSQAAPLLWDPVDGKYSNIVNGGVVPVGSEYVWKTATGGVPVHFKTTNRRGKYTAKYTNTGSTNGFKKAGLGGRNFPGSKVLYVSWWMWLDKTACTASSSNKYTRFTDDGGWSSTVQTVIWEPNSLIIFGVDAGNYVNWSSTCGKTGAWQRMEQIVDNTTSPISPSVYLAHDNVPKGNQPIKAPFSLLKPITGIGCIGFDGSNTAAADQPTVDWGEIYVDNTRARVEIGNAPSWSSCTHREIQIPSAWADGSISIMVSQGSFADNERAYLYVVDASGNYNVVGQPVVFGKGSQTSLARTPQIQVSGSRNETVYDVFGRTIERVRFLRVSHEKMSAQRPGVHFTVVGEGCRQLVKKSVTTK